MERVVKRYLMHSQDETDDDPKLNELEDLKQELQIMKYDIVNDLKKSKEENIKNANMLNNSLQFVAEEVVVSEDEYEDEDQAREAEAYLKYQESLAEDGGIGTILPNVLVRSASMEDPLNNGDSAVILNNSSEENLFAKKNEKFIHNSFFDSFIDNFDSSSYPENDLMNNDLATGGGEGSTSNSNNSAAMLLKRANRYKVTFDFDAAQNAAVARGLYKISEESSNAERTSEISKNN
jgi:hypothetical protein